MVSGAVAAALEKARNLKMNAAQRPPQIGKSKSSLSGSSELPGFLRFSQYSLNAANDFKVQFLCWSQQFDRLSWEWVGCGL